ncbi:MAG: hypothetical protein SFW08_08025 [Gemmatimonadaceae bacterium]|nr:hypothetical protein [Gemmatimonadaceae bacterium]
MTNPTSLSVRFRFDPLEPGVWPLDIAAHYAAREAALKDPQSALVVTARVWLVISEDRALSVFNSFPAAIFGDSLVQRAGRYERYPKGRRLRPRLIRQGAAPELRSVFPQPNSGLEATIGVTYLNGYTLQSQPVSRALVVVYRCDWTGDCYEDYSAETNSAGQISFACDGYHSYITEVYYSNNRVQAGYPAQTGHSIQPDCVGYNTSVDSSQLADAFVNTTKFADLAASWGRTTPRLLLYLISSGSSYYSKANSTIHIRLGNAFSPWGHWVQAHEFGHALHDKALGSWYEYRADSDGHSFSSIEHWSVAWVEGVANFLADMLFGPSPFFSAESWAINSLPSWPLAPDGGLDGSRSEGQVASFLWDLADSTQDHPADVTVAGFNGVLSLIKACEVYIGGQYAHAVSLEHAVLCAERQADPLVANSSWYFRSRQFVASAQRLNGYSLPLAFPSTSSVRALWRKVLYNED